MLHYVTAGESHGQALVAILSGYPAGVPVTEDDVNTHLAERQKGYGRGGRMKIEKDRATFLTGVRLGRSLGSPITLMIKNRDWENWEESMTPAPGTIDPEQRVTRPRPGHADLPGILKFNQQDVRNILERASARETAARVAVGAVCRTLLRHFGIEIYSFVVNIGGVKTSLQHRDLAGQYARARQSEVRCPDEETATRMMARIDEAMSEGDSLGGVFEVIATGLPAGLGSVMTADDRLDADIARVMMGIPAMKGVEIGLGFGVADLPGSAVHDPIFYNTPDSGQTNPERLEGHGHSGGFFHTTNGAGGIEGGMTNGEPVVVRVAMKPIPTLSKPLQSVDIETKEAFDAAKERSDACAVPAAAVVGEAALAFVLLKHFLVKFGGDSLEEISRNFNAYVKYLNAR